ncbi:hypothetical protein C2G38_2200858 [Gigaspora rosea]|uniref:Uncharacterized protein n=1 Tax=Gigaspora rosea TaxID=44941 RepID=A0A397URE8_9GLOM|nr:hypothetical protein C2G38_2200858 [Gigaspora rosea]
MSGLSISIIIDKKDRTLPKPFNNCPGYDMRYVQSYVLNYCGYGGEQLERLYATERLYDNLSIVRQDENLIQWAVRVRIDLQDLLLQQKFSVYHQSCLFASFPGVPSNARLAWNSLGNDNTPDDMKFLGLTRREVKNSQTREQFNQWRTKWIELYKNNPMMCSSIINRQYKEYYIPDNWIECKKSQLLVRFQKRLLKLEA